MTGPYRIVPMDEAQARAYLSWEYPEPYAFYTVPPAHREEELRTILDRSDGEYYAALDEAGEMVGIFAYEFPDGMMELGLGLRPDLTGQGLGEAFVRQCLAFGLETYRHQGPVVLLVADFNRRAIRLYEKLGFQTASEVTRSSFGEEVTFLFMVLSPQADPRKNPTSHS